jgi:polysaccharide export outer membrane protein
MRHHRKWMRLAAGPLMAALLHMVIGCAAGQVVSGPAAQAGAEGDGDSYVIGQADELEIQVWQEPDLSRSATVRADGKVSLPMIEDIKAEGLTIKQLRELLADKYKDLVTAPVVSVMVTKPFSATFFVTGKVAKPGEYALVKQTTLLQAIATAGGFTEWAKTGKLAVIRKGGQRLRVSYDDVVSGDMSQNLTLERGDTIVVP